MVSGSTEEIATRAGSALIPEGVLVREEAPVFTGFLRTRDLGSRIFEKDDFVGRYTRELLGDDAALDLVSEIPTLYALDEFKLDQFGNPISRELKRQGKKINPKIYGTEKSKFSMVLEPEYLPQIKSIQIPKRRGDFFLWDDSRSIEIGNREIGGVSRRAITIKPIQSALLEEGEDAGLKVLFLYTLQIEKAAFRALESRAIIKSGLLDKIISNQITKLELEREAEGVLRSEAVRLIRGGNLEVDNILSQLSEISKDRFGKALLSNDELIGLEARRISREARIEYQTAQEFLEKNPELKNIDSWRISANEREIIDIEKDLEKFIPELDNLEGQMNVIIKNILKDDRDREALKRTLTEILEKDRWKEAIERMKTEGKIRSDFNTDTLESIHDDWYEIRGKVRKLETERDLFAPTHGDQFVRRVLQDCDNEESFVNRELLRQFTGREADILGSTPPFEELELARILTSRREVLEKDIADLDDHTSWVSFLTREEPSIKVKITPATTFIREINNLAQTRVSAPVKTLSKKMISRTTVIGDLHGDYDGLVEILYTSGLVDEKLAWKGSKERLVIMGDIVDSINPLDPTGEQEQKIIELLISLQESAKSQGGNIVILPGNHEVGHLANDFIVKNIETIGMPAYLMFRSRGKQLAGTLENPGPLRQAILDGKIQAAYVDGDNLFVHGGLSKPVLEDITQKLGKDTSSISPEEIADELNRRFRKAVETDDWNDVAFIGDLKDTALHKRGIFDNSLRDEDKDLIDQVIGHIGTESKKIETNGKIIMTDTEISGKSVGGKEKSRAFLVFDEERGVPKAFSVEPNAEELNKFRTARDNYNSFLTGGQK